MVKLDIDDLLKKNLEGERIINPAYNNPEIAHEIAEKVKEDNLRQQGGLRKIEKTIAYFYGKKDLAIKLLQIQPLYYDEFKNWWIWDKDNLYWKITDDVNILNILGRVSNANTVNSKEKNEILEALRQRARIHKPESIKPTWIQFRDKIVDIQTGKRFDATSDYFVTNPISYNLHNGNFEQTPVMDRIFEEWVGKDYVKTLYEIIS